MEQIVDKQQNRCYHNIHNIENRKYKRVVLFETKASWEWWKPIVENNYEENLLGTVGNKI